MPLKAMNRNNSTTTIVIAGGNSLFRRGMADFLHELIPYRLLAELADSRQLPGALLHHQPTMAIVEFSQESSHAAETVRFLAARKTSTAGIVMAPYSDGLLLINAHFAGIGACIVLDQAAEELPAAVSAVMAGEPYLSPRLGRLLSEGEVVAATEREPGLAMLTRAEKRVLELIAASKSTALIADELHISPRTVDHHRLRICRKLNLSGRYSLLRFALDNRRLLSSLQILIFTVIIPT